MMPKRTPTDNDLIREYVPSDNSRQSDSLTEVLRVLNETHLDHNATVLDLGCGTGASFAIFQKHSPSLRWIGIDIPESPEVNRRNERAPNLVAYDGMHLPVRPESVRLVYSHQVFEHVRSPQKLLTEIYEALEVNGKFVGSTSHLEPYHSRSTWNFTPFGFCELLKAAGFRSIIIRPSIDALTLISRRAFSFVRLQKLFNPFFRHESPLNIGIEMLTLAARMNAKQRNLAKLLFCGQFTFVATK